MSPNSVDSSEVSSVGDQIASSYHIPLYLYILQPGLNTTQLTLLDSIRGQSDSGSHPRVRVWPARLAVGGRSW